MPIIQIRDLDDAVYALLAERARQERRSLSQQAAVTLAEALSASPDQRRRRAALLEAIAADRTARWPASLPDPADLIREDRAR